MRAVVFVKPGSAGLVLTEVPVPAPRDRELLVRVCATTVTRGDVVLSKLPPILARLFGIPRKAALGHEYAGVVESLGARVTRFRRGDRVFGTTTALTTGAHAEYICVPEEGMVATLPASVTLDEAAPIPIGALTALELLGRTGVTQDKRVLVIGASGSVGSYTVQLAGHLGAHVTGVSSTANLGLVASLGAERVIDYTRHDFTQGGERYDVTVDAVGASSLRRYRRLLAEGGSLVSTRSTTRERPGALRYLRDLLARGVIRAVVDRRYQLEQIREAHAYVERGHKRGNVVILLAAPRQRSSGRC